MTDLYVRILGTVEDMDGVVCPVGVDYDTVTIGGFRFTAGGMEELAQLAASATWQAGQQQARMTAATLPDHAPHGEPGCICGRTAAVCAQAGRQAAGQP